MNQRIQELIEQATIKTSYQYHTWGDRIATKTKEVFDQEKFAELIIKECVGILDDEDDYGPYSCGVRSAVYRIKKRFGVEE
jgi:hypothetical protein